MEEGNVKFLPLCSGLRVDTRSKGQVFIKDAWNLDVQNGLILHTVQWKHTLLLQNLSLSDAKSRIILIIGFVAPLFLKRWK